MTLARKGEETTILAGACPSRGERALHTLHRDAAAICKYTPVPDGKFFEVRNIC